MGFKNRRAAGQQLAESVRLTLAALPPLPTLVLGVPRGGVPVAYEVALALDSPLDIWLVRKIGMPGQEELAAGAIADGGVEIWNSDVLGYSGLNPSDLAKTVARERAELERRRHVYCGDHRAPDVRDRRIVLVDDGIATGASLFAAIESLRHAGVAELYVAVPVAPVDTCRRMQSLVEGLICPLQPENFRAIGMWYDEFGQTSDDEVIELLAQSAKRRLQKQGSKNG